MDLLASESPARVRLTPHRAKGRRFLTDSVDKVEFEGRFYARIPLLPVRLARLEGGGSTMRFIERICSILRDEEAATAVEYSVMLALILIAMIGVIGMVGSQSGGMWGGIEGDLRDVGFFD